MALIKVTFQLTGANAGRTMTLRNKYSFVDGLTTLMATPEQMALHAHSLETNWAVYPLGDPRLNPKEPANEQREVQEGSERDRDEHVQGGGESGGSGAPASEPSEVSQGAAAAGAGQSDVPAGGDGHQEGLIVDPVSAAAAAEDASPEPKALVNGKLVRALEKLNPATDSDWTKDGKPAMTAVEALYGASDITRADVEAAAPGLSRSTAKPVKE